jgi:hypothetical protein
LNDPTCQLPDFNLSFIEPFFSFGHRRLIVGKLN